MHPVATFMSKQSSSKYFSKTLHANLLKNSLVRRIDPVCCSRLSWFKPNLGHRLNVFYVGWGLFLMTC